MNLLSAITPLENLSRILPRLLFEEALEDDLLPAAEDNVEGVSNLSEREHEIKDNSTSVEVMNTLIEALGDFADRIFLYCDAVDMMKPL